jgi:phosphotransferase system HPr (HPr) family protein
MRTNGLDSSSGVGEGGMPRPSAEASTLESAPLQEIISEQAFLPLLRPAVRPLFELGLILKGLVQPPTKKYLFRLTQEADEVESFLDDYGARNNKLFSHFGEMIASLRGLGLAAYSLRHVWGRIDLYVLDRISVERKEQFRRELRQGLDFLVEGLFTLQIELQHEGRRMGLERLAWEYRTEEQDHPGEVRHRLPHNIDEGDIRDERAKVAEVVTTYLKATEQLARLRIDAQLNDRRAAELRARIGSEVLCRQYETTVHNVQSKYDTYVQNTALEGSSPELRSLRGHASVALHLLECATCLSHFYERHENDIRYEAAKERIAALIEKRRIVELIVGLCLRWGAEFLLLGRSTAEAMIERFTERGSLHLVIPEGVVLHARPCSLIVRVVNHHGTPVEMEIEEERCDASSIMQVMILASSNSAQRAVVFHGDKSALRDLQRLFDVRLGEGCDLPEDLAYLRI